jgi:hypothetical protein
MEERNHFSPPACPLKGDEDDRKRKGRREAGVITFYTRTRYNTHAYRHTNDAAPLKTI